MSSANYVNLSGPICFYVSIDSNSNFQVNNFEYLNTQVKVKKNATSGLFLINFTVVNLLAIKESYLKCIVAKF